MNRSFERARDLVSGSVADLDSSLRCSRARGGESAAVLSIARDLAESMGQTTMRRRIEREIRISQED
jgi:hypothetical protein